MLGGLYEDLPPPSSSNSQTTSTQNISENSQKNAELKKPTVISEWSVGAKIVPPSLRRLDVEQPPVPIPILKPRSVHLKPPQKKKPPKKKHTPTSVSMNHSQVSSGSEPSLQTSSSTSEDISSEVDDQYDPIKPNDYEIFLEKRTEMHRREKEQERERELDLLEALKPKKPEFQPPSSYFVDVSNEETAKQDPPDEDIDWDCIE